VLAACASAMRLAKPNKLEQLLTLLPEEYIVEKINNDPKSTWTAGVNENLASIDIEDKIRALGTEVYTEAPFVCWVLLDCDVQCQSSSTLAHSTVLDVSLLIAHFRRSPRTRFTSQTTRLPPFPRTLTRVRNGRNAFTRSKTRSVYMCFVNARS
jgi:hypothetical protein